MTSNRSGEVTASDPAEPPRGRLLAAPVVSWVRKRSAGPVASAAGSVNVGMPVDTNRSIQ